MNFHFDISAQRFLNKTPHVVNVISPYAVTFERSGRAILREEANAKMADLYAFQSFGRPVSVKDNNTYRITTGNVELYQQFPELLVEPEDISYISASDVVIVSSRCGEAIIQGIYQNALPSLKLRWDLLDRFYTPHNPVYEKIDSKTLRKVGVLGFKRVLPLASPLQYASVLNALNDYPTEAPISAASAMATVDIALRTNPMAAWYDTSVSQLIEYLRKRRVWVDVEQNAV